MKIKFLGTAAAEGVPALYCDCAACELARKNGGRDIRTRSQAVIDGKLLIDFPADTYMHVLHYALELHKISHILITHSHSDHFYMDDIKMRLPGFSNLGNDKKLNIYANKRVCEILKSDRHIAKLTGKDILKVHTLSAFLPEKVGEYSVTALMADHEPKEDAFIYLIEKDGKALLYAHDTGYFPKETMEYLEKAKPHIDFATFDCCYSLNHCEKGHLGFDEVLEMKRRLCDIGVINDKTVICVNHFSHNGCETFENMNSHTMKYGILTTYDSMETEF